MKTKPKQRKGTKLQKLVLKVKTSKYTGHIMGALVSLVIVGVLYGGMHYAKTRTMSYYVVYQVSYTQDGKAQATTASKIIDIKKAKYLNVTNVINSLGADFEKQTRLKPTMLLLIETIRVK